MTYLDLSDIRKNVFFGTIFDELNISEDLANVQIEEGSVEYQKIIEELKELQEEYVYDFYSNLLKKGYDKETLRTFTSSPSEVLHSILIGERNVYGYIEEDDFKYTEWDEYQSELFQEKMESEYERYSSHSYF